MTGLKQTSKHRHFYFEDTIHKDSADNGESRPTQSLTGSWSHKFGMTWTNTCIITNSHQNTKMNERLIKEWSSVPPAEFLRLGGSLSRDAEAILAAHGGPTPYKDTLT